MKKDLGNIYIAGHNGMVGSALCRFIDQSTEYSWFGARRSELDLTNKKSVLDYIGDHQLDTMIIAAAKVGGIMANNDHPVEFLTENLQIQLNLISAAHQFKVKNLLFLGSSCIYPKMCPQPIKEEYLLTGPLEPTNEPYAIAKIAGVKMIQAYRRQFGYGWISAMPTNLYGPKDNFDLVSSHVLPAMIRKFHDAKIRVDESVTLWGSGSPKREFLHVDDLASASIHLLENFDSEIAINVGTGTDISIKDLAGLVRTTVGFDGEVSWDSSKPDGTPRKLLDTTLISSLGWKPDTELAQGISETYEWYLANN